MRRKHLRRVLVLVAAVALSLPPVHWRLIGWCCGEAFYAGRPVSFHRPLCDVSLGPRPGCCSVCDPDDWPRVRWFFGDRAAEWLRPGPNPLFQGDPAAVPVLLALLRDPDWEIRIAAADCLARVAPAAKACLPLLHSYQAKCAEDHYYYHFIANCIAAIERPAVVDDGSP